MNRRFLSVLMFAFVVAAGASLVLYRLVVGRMSATAPQATTSIMVATKNLDVGAVIVEADLRTAAWPGAVPQGAILKPVEAIGRGILAPIYANEPVTQGRLGAPGAGGGLAATIPTGMRAVAIRVNEVVGVAGFVVAGTHVDVLVSGSPEGNSGGNITRTLLQDISVLSAGQDFKKDMEGKPVTVQVVNLLVTPREAEMLSLAGGQMTLQLVLRNPMDKIITASSGVTMANIFSGEPIKPAATAPLPRQAPRAPVAAVAVAPPPVVQSPRMEIIEGNKRTEISLQKKTVTP